MPSESASSPQAEQQDADDEQIIICDPCGDEEHDYCNDPEDYYQDRDDGSWIVKACCCSRYYPDPEPNLPESAWDLARYR
jgi:hypothetical protein